MSWSCHGCSAGQFIDPITNCPNCGLTRLKSSRASAPPIPEAAAIDQERRIQMENPTQPYMVWTETFGAQQVLNFRVEPPGKPEPPEMKMLLEVGWVCLRPGHYQREIEPVPIMIFDKPGFVGFLDKASNQIKYKRNP